MEQEVIAHIGDGYMYNLAVHGNISSSSLAVSREKIWGNIKNLQDGKRFTTESFEADVSNVSSISVRAVADPVMLGVGVVVLTAGTPLSLLPLIMGGGIAGLFATLIPVLLIGICICLNAKSQALAINVQGREYIAVSDAGAGELNEFITTVREVSSEARKRFAEARTNPVIVQQGASLKQKLEELNELRTSGLISEDEFNEERKTIMENF